MRATDIIDRIIFNAMETGNISRYYHYQTPQYNSLSQRFGIPTEITFGELEQGKSYLISFTGEFRDIANAIILDAKEREITAIRIDE